MLNTATGTPSFHLLKAYYELCKPNVVLLMLLTSVVGMFLASKNGVAWPILIFGNLGIGLTACAGAVINHVVDRHLDGLMHRTSYRPLPTRRVNTQHALWFAVIMAVTGLLILITFVNTLTAVLTLLSLIGYAGIYTLYLKRKTPQNIVMGGLAGAAPPMLGWVAVTNQLDYNSLILVMIIFAWTPPHFWALAIHRHKEYAKVNIPMLPVTHGITYTKYYVLLYTLLLFAVSLLPVLTGMSSVIYLCGAVILGLGFLYWAILLIVSKNPLVPMKTFRYSIIYLMLLFVVLLLDHYFIL